MKTRILSTGGTGWQFLPPEWPVANTFSAKMIFLPETLGGKKPQHLSGVEGRDGLTPATGRCHHPALQFPGRNIWSSRACTVMRTALQLAQNTWNCVIVPILTVHLQMSWMNQQQVDGKCFLTVKIFLNTFSHCMLKIFLASKWSYLLPALVAVGARRRRAGTGLGRAQGCASHPHIPHVQAL